MLSEYALRLARHIAHVSEKGLRSPISWPEIVASFDADDRGQLAEAAFELELCGLLKVSRGANDPDGIAHLRPYFELYWAFDGEVLNYPTERDVATLIEHLLADANLGSAPKLLEAVGWSPRRFNPAFARIVDVFPDGRVSGEVQPNYPAMAVIMTSEDRARLRQLLAELDLEADDDGGATKIEPAAAEQNTTEPPLAALGQALENTALKKNVVDFILEHRYWTGIGGIAAIVALVISIWPESGTRPATTNGSITAPAEQPEETPSAIVPSETETLRDNETENPATLTIAYDADFLGRVHIPLPNITDARAAGDLLDGAPFHYTHFSIAIDERRGLALYAAANIDRAQSRDIRRDQIGDKWRLDSRVPRDLQRGDDLYVGNDFDRGHLVRYKEVAWGENALAAAQATQTYVNTTPQHKDFNRRAWSYLERYILAILHPDAERLTVFSGPVHRNDDYEYRGARIPRSFWKVVAIADPNDDRRIFSYAYVLDQYRLSDGELIPTPGPTPGGFDSSDFQVSIATIESLTPLRFGVVKDFDTHQAETAAVVPLQTTEQVEETGFYEYTKVAVGSSMQITLPAGPLTTTLESVDGGTTASIVLFDDDTEFLANSVQAGDRFAISVQRYPYLFHVTEVGPQWLSFAVSQDHEVNFRQTIDLKWAERGTVRLISGSLTLTPHSSNGQSVGLLLDDRGHAVGDYTLAPGQHLAVTVDGEPYILTVREVKLEYVRVAVTQ